MLTCDDCGCTDDTVRATVCPYAEDINGVEEECNLCSDCYDNRADEI